MEEQTQSVPTLCTAGCGYFGNSANDGLCSKCFRDQQRRKHNQQQRQASTATSSKNQGSPPRVPYQREDTQACAVEMGGDLGATPLSDLPASSSTTPTPSDPLSGETIKTTPKKNRCFTCRKKVGLTGFHCRCGNQFCSLHRYADKHECSFDYKTAGREELERKHPRIVADKVLKL